MHHISMHIEISEETAVEILPVCISSWWDFRSVFAFHFSNIFLNFLGKVSANKAMN